GVIERSKGFDALMIDNTRTRQERSEALKFLVHFVGDIHQPLHCAERAYQNHPRDKGGNRVEVRYRDEPNRRKLHAVWDTTLILDLLAGRKAVEYGDALADALSHPDMQSAICDWERHDTPEQWAAESHELAIRYAYRGIP